ncbi:Qat anti-phage system associated protein QatB [Neobittarella massiliensis]|uniref:Qat anti-phage system associated protein QatB n=1 Tax=Neobittarella massiliensis (ex Bilen et al. 2018) TaxID=2041842 RepID=UPI00101AE179|nr:Qat anti-phage system associated protein QatB [Neobittarella massiliensis]
MGTSTSSMGPGAGVSLDPEWLDDIELPNQENTQQDGQSDDKGGEDDQSDEKERIDNEKSELAPKSRFANARRGMGEYVRSGSKDSLKRSLGHYSKTGMGGAKNLSKRMRTSAKVAANFFQTFQALRDNDNFALSKILSELQGRGANANEIIDTIIDNVCPNGGSLDEISCRDSGRFALSEFMNQNPDADISKLTDDQIWSLTSTFLGNEAFSRIQLDIGQSFERQEVSAVERVDRMNEMKDYLQSEISAQLNRLRNSGLQTIDMQKLFQTAIKNTFEVYEVEV